MLLQLHQHTRKASQQLMALYVLQPGVGKECGHLHKASMQQPGAHVAWHKQEHGAQHNESTRGQKHCLSAHHSICTWLVQE